MEWLEEFHHTTEVRKLTLERSIKSLKQLFKPWPSNNESDGPVDKPELVPPEGVGSDTKPEVPELTSEEQQGVDLADKLLSKALKAREIQRKLEEPKKSRVKGSSAKLKESERKHPQDDSTTHQREIIKPFPDTGVSLSGKSSHISGQKINVANNALCKSNSLIHSAKSTNAKNSNKAPNLPQSQSAKTVTNSSKINARVRDRPVSNSSKVTPAHVKAPFQTNPRLPTAKLQSTYRAATTVKATRGRGVRTNVVKGSNSESSARVGNSGSSSSASARTAILAISDSSHSSSRSDSNNSKESDDVVARMQTEDCNNTMGGMNNMEEGLRNMNVGEAEATNSTDSDQSGLKESRDKQLFQLAKDGASLTLPGKLRKQVHMNRKLREKFYTQTVTRKVNISSTNQNLLARLEQGFDDSEVVQTQLQARQAEHLLRVYQYLSQILDSLHLDKLTEDSPPMDILRAKKLLEYLLETFHNTEEAVRSSDLSLLTTACVCYKDFHERVAVPANSSLSIWYNNIHLHGCERPATLEYRTYRQLERHMSLLFRVQLLQLNLHLMDQAAQLMLPLLHSLRPDTSEYIQVLRCAYSLLSTNPNRVPVIVQDTIQDLSAMDGNQDDEYEDDDGG